MPGTGARALAPAAAAGLKIGLLGGSFNPAHGGHLYMSLLALRRLGLDQVWWLVAPRNPLKAAAGIAPFAERLAAARALVRDPRIRVTDLEARLGSRYTADTLSALRRRFPKARFVWLMGADNLVQIPEWRRWTEVFERHPVAVFERRPYSFRALAGRAARRYGRRQVAPHRAAGLAAMAPPAWVFLHTRPHAASATAIRARRRAAGGREEE